MPDDIWKALAPSIMNIDGGCRSRIEAFIIEISNSILLNEDQLRMIKFYGEEIDEEFIKEVLAGDEDESHSCDNPDCKGYNGK